MGIDIIASETVVKEGVSLVGAVNIKANGIYLIPSLAGIRPNAYAVDGKRVLFLNISNAVPRQGGLYEVDISCYSGNPHTKVRAITPNTDRFSVHEEIRKWSHFVYIDFIWRG